MQAYTILLVTWLPFYSLADKKNIRVCICYFEHRCLQTSERARPLTFSEHCYELIFTQTLKRPKPLRATMCINWRYNYKLQDLTIVSSQKSISVLVLELPIDILFSLLYGNVHVTIQAGQDTCRQAICMYAVFWLQRISPLFQMTLEKQADWLTCSCVTSVINTRVQFDDHRSPNDLLQKVTRGLLPQTHLDCDLKGMKMNRDGGLLQIATLASC